MKLNNSIKNLNSSIQNFYKKTCNNLLKTKQNIVDICNKSLNDNSEISTSLQDRDFELINNQELKTFALPSPSEITATIQRKIDSLVLVKPEDTKKYTFLHFVSISDSANKSIKEALTSFLMPIIENANNKQKDFNLQIEDEFNKFNKQLADLKKEEEEELLAEKTSYENEVESFTKERKEEIEREFGLLGERFEGSKTAISTKKISVENTIDKNLNLILKINKEDYNCKNLDKITNKLSNEKKALAALEEKKSLKDLFINFSSQYSEVGKSIHAKYEKKLEDRKQSHEEKLISIRDNFSKKEEDIRKLFYETCQAIESASESLYKELIKELPSSMLDEESKATLIEKELKDAHALDLTSTSDWADNLINKSLHSLFMPMIEKAHEKDFILEIKDELHKFHKQLDVLEKQKKEQILEEKTTYDNQLESSTKEREAELERDFGLLGAMLEGLKTDISAKKISVENTIDKNLNLILKINKEDFNSKNLDKITNKLTNKKKALASLEEKKSLKNLFIDFSSKYSEVGKSIHAKSKEKLEAIQQSHEEKLASIEDDFSKKEENITNLHCKKLKSIESQSEIFYKNLIKDLPSFMLDLEITAIEEQRATIQTEIQDIDIQLNSAERELKSIEKEELTSTIRTEPKNRDTNVSSKSESNWVIKNAHRISNIISESFLFIRNYSFIPNHSHIQ